MGIEDIKKGKISFILPCLFLIKLKLPTDVTNKLSDKEIIGIAKVFMPNIAINAVYDDPPPRPTEEYVNATIKKRIAKKYGDVIVRSILIEASFCRFYTHPTIIIEPKYFDKRVQLESNKIHANGNFIIIISIIILITL